MAKQTINIGTTPLDGTGDPLRKAFDKANDNFTELYGITGWAVYNDTTYTSGSPFLVTAGAPAQPLPNNAGTKIESQLPIDVLAFYTPLELVASVSAGTFIIGETITGGTSGATATLIELEGADTLFRVTSITGSFTNGEVLTGGTSGATAGLVSQSEGLILGRNGDGVLITIEFSCAPTTAASDVRIKTTIDIGGAIGEIYPYELPLTKGNGVQHFFLESFSAYTLDTWQSNGGQIMVESFNSNVNIYDIRYVITRTHKAK